MEQVGLRCYIGDGKNGNERSIYPLLESDGVYTLGVFYVDRGLVRAVDEDTGRGLVDVELVYLDKGSAMVRIADVYGSEEVNVSRGDVIRGSYERWSDAKLRFMEDLCSVLIGEHNN